MPDGRAASDRAIAEPPKLIRPARLCKHKFPPTIQLYFRRYSGNSCSTMISATGMSQFFRGRSESGGGRSLEKELQALERQVKTASPGYETQFLNRASSLCVQAGEPQRALGYLGRAIDAYLESGRFSAAEVACNKILEIAPNAVRPRCTLAWLSIAKGYRASTERDITGYVQAARRSANEGLAAKQLRMMAEAASNPELRELIAELLLDLEDPEGAERAFGRVYAERNGLRPPRVHDEGELWAKLLRAALMGPKELKAQTTESESEVSEDANSQSDELPTLDRE